MNVLLFALTFIFILIIVWFYPDMVKGKLKDIGHKKRSQTAFILTDINLFSILFFPLILTSIAALLIDLSNEYGWTKLLLIYIVLFMVCFVILYTEASFYFNNREPNK